MVEMRSISYRASGTPILREVNVRFEPRRFNVILGPNGAGKSTLLKLAAGLFEPTQGVVMYEGDSIAGQPAETLARKRAVLSQHIEMAFALSVQDVVMMGRYPHYRRAPSGSDRDIVEQALGLVGMTARRAQSYATLSGGERQKVQLARVLSQIWSTDEADGHRYLFLDEPVASLDIHYQIHVLDIARGLLARDFTVVAILHDLNQAFQYGDNFLLLDAGSVACQATHADGITPDIIERVFNVRASKVVDSATQQALWRFSL